MFHHLLVALLVILNGPVSSGSAPDQSSRQLNWPLVSVVYKEARSMYHLRDKFENKLSVIQSLIGESNFRTEKLCDKLKKLYIDSDVALMTTKLLIQLVPQNETVQHESIDDYFEGVTNALADECLGNTTSVACRFKTYRPFDGMCSNLERPNEGAANTAYSRLMSPKYADSVVAIRKSVTGEELPLPRMLVTSLFLPKQLIDAKRLALIPNAGSIMFGQLVTHDVGSKQAVRSTTTQGPGIRCCTQTGNQVLTKDLLHSACLPIIVPKTDKAYSIFNITCLNNVRSQTVTPGGCPVLGAAQQINAVTSLLDLSIVYGSSKADSDALRSMKDGLFNMTANGFLTQTPGCTGTACFRTADSRANQTPFLLIWHLIWYREHNRIARIFKSLNPFWTDQTIFQETRRLVIAIYQHSVYKEFLPAYLSQRVMRRYKLNTDNVDFWKVGHVDGRTTNEFSHAIFRRFHNLSPGVFDVLNANNNVISRLKVADVILKTQMVEKLYDQIIRGMLNQTMNVETPHEDFSFKLFQNSKGIGLDLFSMDIQRGRDHGLAPYYVYRKNCGLKPVERFEDLYPSMSRETIANLQEHYANVFDIDLAAGAGLEELNGEILGPTTQCIMADQFHRYKFGDPYFYSNHKQPHYFNKRQIREIRKFTIARLFCDNSDLRRVPRNSFFSPGPSNPMIDCEDVGRMDMGAWKARNKRE